MYMRMHIKTGDPRHFPMSGIEVEHWPAGK